MIKHNGAIKFDDPVVLETKYLGTGLADQEITLTKIYLYKGEIWGKDLYSGDINLTEILDLEDDWRTIESSVDELELEYPAMDLHYSTHLSTDGKSYHITATPDIGINEGGLYCEIYEDADVLGDPIDNFVIELGDDPDRVAKKYMTENYGLLQNKA